MPKKVDILVALFIFITALNLAQLFGVGFTRYNVF